MAEPIYFSNNADPGMQQAIKLARKTFRVFWRELSWEYRRIVPGLDLACIKAAFTDTDDIDNAEDVEQMWVNDITFDGRVLYGTLINQPNWLTSVEQGDDVKIKPSALTDWMYATSGDVCGAFTVNHMRSQMPKNERKAHDDAWGLNFGKPDVMTFVPPEYLGEKKKKGLLGKLSGGGGSQDPAQVISTEHPMALNMVEKIADFAKDKSNMTMTDNHGFNVLHHCSMAGAAKCVRRLIKLGADQTVKTKRGMTAEMLARRMGWKNVLKALG